MKNLVGKKMRGFAFYSNDNCSPTMNKQIDKVGEVKEQYKSRVVVQFKDACLAYPLPEALQHIVQEDTIVPELKEGVLMEVSHDGQRWWKERIIAKYKNNYINSIFVCCKYARPIQPKKLTIAELEELVGGKFEIVNEE